MNYIDKVLGDSVYKNEIIKLFYLFPVSKDDISRYTDTQLEQVARVLISIIKETSIEDIVDIIEASKENIAELTSANIPQFSNIELINDVLDVVNSTDNISFEEIGYYLNKSASKGAQTKFGENHYKTAALIGLTTQEKPFSITYLGKQYMILDTDKKENVRNKLFLRVPIVQTIVIDAKYKKTIPMDILKKYLSESTSIRRRSNVRTMVDYVCKSADVEFQMEIQKNLDWK